MHVVSPEGEAKFWIEPTVALADFIGLNRRQLSRLQKIVENRRDEIIGAWQDRFFGNN